MHRIDADAHVANAFSEGDPTVPRLPTRIDAAWLNAVQEELAQMVLAAGLSLIKGVAQLPAVTAFLGRVQSWTARQTFTRGLVAESSSAGGPGLTATANLDVGISATSSSLRYAIEATSGSAPVVRFATSGSGQALVLDRTAGTGLVLDAAGGKSQFSGVSGTAAPVRLVEQISAPSAPSAGDVWLLPSTATVPAALYLHDGYANAKLLTIWKAASAPTSGRESGDLYYDTTTNRMYCWDGSAWNALW